MRTGVSVDCSSKGLHDGKSFVIEQAQQFVGVGRDVPDETDPQSRGDDQLRDVRLIVEDEQFGRRGERGDQRHLLPVAAGQLADGDGWVELEALGDETAIVIGDIVGHSIDAAIAMGQLRAAVRALAGVSSDPHAVLDGLEQFVEQVPATRLATFIYALWNRETARLRYHT